MEDFFRGFFRLTEPTPSSQANATMSSSSCGSAPSNASDNNLDHLNQFLRSLAERNASQRTINAYNHDIQKLIESLEENVRVLKTKDVERFIERLANSGAKFSTVKRTLSALREFFSFLVDLGICEQNPAANVKITPVPQNVLSSENIVYFFQYLARGQQSQNSTVSLRYRRDEVILHLMVFLGVRQYQIPLLKLSSIEHSEEMLTLRVNDQLLLNLPGTLLSRLREYLSLRNSKSDTIFLDPLDGIPIRPSAVHSLLRELNHKFGLHCTSLTLYHTYLRLHSNPVEKQEILSRICPTDEESVFLPAIATQGMTIHA